MIKLNLLRQKSIVCLLELVARNKTNEDKGYVITLFELVPLLSDLINSTITNINDDIYNIHKLLIQMMTQIGTLQLNMFSATTKYVPLLFTYLQFMIKSLEYPSLTINLLVLPYFCTLYQNEYIKQQPYYRDLTITLLKLLEIKLKKKYNSFDEIANKIEDPFNYFCNLDFETEGEYQHSFSSFRNKLKELIIIVAQKQTDLLLDYLQFRLEQTINQVNEVGIVNEEEDNGLITYIEWSIDSLDTKDIPFKSLPIDIQQKILSIYNLINRYPINNSNNNNSNITNIIELYRVFIPLFNVKVDLIPLLLDKLFSFVTYIGAGENNIQNMSNNTVAIRRKSCTTLLLIVSKLSVHFINYLIKLITIKEEYSSKGLLLDSEKVYLLDVIVTISNSIPNKQEQYQLLFNSIINPLLITWNLPEIQNTIKQASNLAILLFPTVETPQSEITKQIYYLVHSFSVILKKVITHIEIPITILSQITIPTFQLIDNIHTFNNSAFQAQYITSTWLPSLEIDDSYTAPLLGIIVKSKQLDIPHKTRSVRVWIETIRDFCYSLLGSSCSTLQPLYSLYYLPNLLNYFHLSFLNHLPLLHYRHLKSILSILFFSLIIIITLLNTLTPFHNLSFNHLFCTVLLNIMIYILIM